MIERWIPGLASPIALTILLSLFSNQQRQLNSYGFQRITQGRDKVGWTSRNAQYTKNDFAHNMRSR
jgi:hypothetical protein